MFTRAVARFFWLKLCCAVAEGALLEQGNNVVAALFAKHSSRFAVMNGCAQEPRALGSVFAAGVTLFLGGWRGSRGRGFALPAPIQGMLDNAHSAAVSLDGRWIFLTSRFSPRPWLPRDPADCIFVFDVATGALARKVGKRGTGPLEFNHPCQICVAADDGVVYVADLFNARIQVLAPELTFLTVMCHPNLVSPAGVCVNETTVAVSEFHHAAIFVFRRHDSVLLQRFNLSHGLMANPTGVYFMPGGQEVSVFVHVLCEQRSGVTASRLAIFRASNGAFVRTIDIPRPEGVNVTLWRDMAIHSHVVTSSGEIFVSMFSSQAYAWEHDDAVCFIFATDCDGCVHQRVAMPTACTDLAVHDRSATVYAVESLWERSDGSVTAIW